MIKAKSLPNNKEQIEFSPIFKSYFFLILSQPEITMEVTPPGISGKNCLFDSFLFSLA